MISNHKAMLPSLSSKVGVLSLSDYDDTQEIAKMKLSNKSNFSRGSSIKYIGSSSSVHHIGGVGVGLTREKSIFISKERASICLTKMTTYEESISSLYNYITENIEDILVDPTILSEFEMLSVLSVEKAEEVSQLKDILVQHGFTGTQYKLNLLDIESLHQMLGTLYLAKVIQPKMLAEDHEDFSSDPDVFLQEDSLVKSFCPNSILHIISADIMFELTYKEMQPKSIGVYGACVLADISGFTKMSARHCQDGSRGLDKLHQATNGFLGRLVKLVYSYGGDVISFAGDALVCTFVNEEQFLSESSGGQAEVDRLVMKELCLRAMQCALELKEQHTSDLTAHIAISCGNMSFATLGGVGNQWVYLVNGSCISDLSQCIDDAASRELVVSPRCYQAVHDCLVQGESLEVTKVSTSDNIKVISIQSPIDYMKKNNRITQFETTEELLDLSRLFVPRPAQYAISSGSFDHINELREVTTMFFKLDSYNKVANENPITLQPFFTMAQNALKISGGFMRQFLIDDKGCVLIGMWGVPSFSHANNSTRALYCASLIMQGLKTLDHKGSIGITTGSIYCGNVGSVLRRDYVGIGDKVNLAARLMGKAKGAIFVDEISFKQLSVEAKSVLSRSKEGLALKGIAEPIFPYINKDFDISKFSLSSNKTDSNDMKLDPTVTSILQQQLDKISSINALIPAEEPSSQRRKSMDKLNANTGEASLTVVRGMPGMGKKTSALHFLKIAKDRYMRTVFITLRAGDESKLFGVMRKFILALLDAPDFSKEYDQRLVLEKLVAKVYDSEVAKDKGMIALKIIFDCKWSSDGENISYDKSNLNGDRTLREVIQCLLSKQTTAVVIENAQYSDELSWNELLIVADMPVKVAILVTLSSLQVGGDEFDPKKQIVLKKMTLLNPHRQMSDLNPRHTGRRMSSNRNGDGVFIMRLRSNDFFRKVNQRPRCFVIDLPPLTVEDVSKILQTILKTSSVDESIITLVHDASSGNPFWCNMIANYIKDSGLDDFNQAYANNKSKNPLNVVFICRLEKLSPDNQVVARYASVIGDEFTLSVLYNILPVKFKTNLDNSLVVLSENGFIHCITRNPPSYSFQNLLIRKFLYELTPYSEITKIHESIGKYFELEYADDLRPYYSILSHHYIMCDINPEIAFKYTVKAADQAIYRGAFADGLGFIQAAVKLESHVNDIKVLLRVVERAIADMYPVGFFSRALTSRKNVSEQYLVGQADEIESYKDIRGVLETRLQNGCEEDRLDRKSKNISGISENSRHKPPSPLEDWEPSYTAGKTVKLKPLKQLSVCSIS